jgi:hypothetical protein
MSSAADRARAKAAQIGITRPAEQDVTLAPDPASTTPPPPASQLPVNIKPIRISLDLAPALFDQLTEWRTRAARQLGRGRVTNADALRVLVRMLVSDPELTRRVITELRRENAS